MKATDFYASLKGIVKSLRRAGHSDLDIVEIVRDSFVKSVGNPDAETRAACPVCAAASSGLCERCSARLRDKLDEALYGEDE